MSNEKPQERVGYIDIPAEWIKWGPEQKGDKGPYYTGYIPFFGTAGTVFSSTAPAKLERKGRMVRISLRRGKFNAPKMSAFAEKSALGREEPADQGEF